MIHATLDDWIRDDAIPFSVDSSKTVDASIDGIVASLDPSVELLGFGEALHGGEEILVLRNLLFQRLAEEHGYSAIAIESSFPRARAVNDYVSGRGPQVEDGQASEAEEENELRRQESPLSNRNGREPFSGRVF